MKIRLVGGHSHGRELEWDMKTGGSAIQCPYQENIESIDPGDWTFGIELYTIRRFYARTQPARDYVIIRMWYVAVITGTSDAEATQQYGPLIAHNLPHSQHSTEASVAEKAAWDDRHRAN